MRHLSSAAYGPAHVVLFASWVLVMLGLPGLYARQAHRAGRLGLVGFVVTMIAVAYHLYLTLYEGYAVPVMAENATTRELLGPDQPLTHGAGALGPVAAVLLLGFPLLGVAMLRSAVLPRAAGWLQILAIPAFAVAALTATVAFEGAVGPDAGNWIAGMAPIALQYSLLCAGYAVGGLALRRMSQGAAAAAPEPAALGRVGR